MNIPRKISAWLKRIRFFRLYVIADPNDNSITFSKGLWQHIMHNAPRKESAKVFVFSVPASATFGFIINPLFDRETQIADIQYNEKYRTIGFESLCPSVNLIFNRYRLPAETALRLPVTVSQTLDGKMFYRIERP